MGGLKQLTSAGSLTKSFVGRTAGDAGREEEEVPRRREKVNKKAIEVGR